MCAAMHGTLFVCFPLVLVFIAVPVIHIILSLFLLLVGVFNRVLGAGRVGPGQVISSYHWDGQGRHIWAGRRIDPWAWPPSGGAENGRHGNFSKIPLLSLFVALSFLRVHHHVRLWFFFCVVWAGLGGQMRVGVVGLGCEVYGEGIAVLAAC